MDFWFVAVFALLLGKLDSIKTDFSPQNSSSTTNITTATAPTPPPCPSRVPMSSTLLLGVLAVHWRSDCGGPVLFSQTQKTKMSERVCFSSRSSIVQLLRGVCEQKKGCRGEETLEKGPEEHALRIIGNDVSEVQCETLSVRCEVERPLEEPQEPVRFRVATILLSLAVVFLLLFCFCRPTVKALQKRLSNKRKNRWIGPTQSHSVSYHRGQTVNKNLDVPKHSSYPALDQLVLGSREPSSNRNSYNI